MSSSLQNFSQNSQNNLVLLSLSEQKSPKTDKTESTKNETPKKINQINLDEFINKINPNDKERFFSKISLNERLSSENKIAINAENAMIANFIRSKYKDKIAHFFENNGILPEVVIITKNTKKPRNKQIYNISREPSKIDPRFSFSNFIMGNSNRYAFEVAKNVAQNQATSFNPLVIYGSSGLGKTHLLNAIGNLAQDLDKIVLYTTSEDFFNDFLRNIQNSTTDKFRAKYRNCDYLLIDDVQFFKNKGAVQEEFFHTFNELKNNGKQIVLACDRVPKDIDGLEERLKSRFCCGLLAQIVSPELETKINIIRAKCTLDNIILNRDVIDCIAANVSNSREIEGILMKIRFHINLGNVQEITLDRAKEIVREYVQENLENINLDSILEKTSKYFNIMPSEIKSKSRVKVVSQARRVVIYLARTLTPNSMPILANFFNMKDHSSVSKAMKNIEEEIEKNPNFKIIIEEIKNKLSKN